MSQSARAPVFLQQKYRKRPHPSYGLGFSSGDNGLLLEESIDLEPQQKQKKPESINFQSSDGTLHQDQHMQTETGEAGDVEMNPLKVETNREKNKVQVDLLDDSEEEEELEDGERKLIFKIPLNELIISHSKKEQKESP